MAAVYLIRHGQASFDKDDYDHLSETGFKQAEILGRYWHTLPHPQPDKIYRGDMLRHQQTMDSFFAGYENMYSNTSITDPNFNEFDHIAVLKGHIKDWPNLSTLTEFEHAFVSAFQRWQSGKHDADYAESWPQFKQRCVRAFENLMMQADGAKTILVFTSGGTISVILQQILALSDQHTMRFNQQIRNTSVTRLLFSGSRLSVDYINNFSHLEQAGAEWVTYR